MAERAFAGRPDLEVTSAGLASDAEEIVTPETLERAELIFVMEKVHRARLRRRFGPHPRNARVVCLDIADDHQFMEAGLVTLLQMRVCPHLCPLR